LQMAPGARLAHALESSVTSVQPEGRVAEMLVAVIVVDVLVSVAVAEVPLPAVSSTEAGFTVNVAGAAGMDGGVPESP
jgi:hypothetical protein